LRAAMRHAETHRPALARSALVRMGELRRRQGNVGEAAARFERMGAHPLAVLGRADLALERGLVPEAVDLLQSLLRRIPCPFTAERIRPLEVATRAYVAAKRFDDAQRMVHALRSISHAVGTEPLRAAATAARGLLLAATGQASDARFAFEDAIARYEAGGERYALARTRVELARVLDSLGRRAAAI